jgi:CRISPR system Cascade subunit CasA
VPLFDLITQPWIPVSYQPDVSGAPETGLAELLTRAHEIADITLPVPPTASGLWRVLYLIAARISGLGDLESAPGLVPWKRERARILTTGRFEPEAVSGYFAAYADRFDLFHPDRPWLQDPRLAAECAKSTGINKLVMGRSAGNNLVWLSHHTDLAPQPVRAAEAAWYLLAWLYYGPSGMITPRTVRGRTESNMTAGPLRSRISFHPLGRNLFESLVAGIPYPGPSSGRPDPDTTPWEDGTLPDPLGLPPTREGLSGPLTGQFRHAVLLIPSPDGTHVTDTRITWAWRMTAAEIEDPYLIYDTPRNGGVPYARYARADRAIWRDLDALLLKDTGSGKARRPTVFDDLPDQTIAGTIRVRAFGFDQDGQVKDTQWFTASTPPVLSAHDTGDAAAVYDNADEIGATREAAERVADDLKKALQRAWAALSDPSDGQAKTRRGTPDGPWVARGMSRYWAAAETEFWHMVDHLNEFDLPNNRFIRIAVAAYDDVTGDHAARSPRVVRVLEKARSAIYATWSQIQPLPWKPQMPELLRVPPTADALSREITRLARKSPADRSVLRHSLGKPPVDVALGVHRIVVPFLPGSPDDAAERAYYAVAALIASQPRDARDNTDGDASRDSAAGPPQEDVAAAGQRRRNLGYSLAQAVGKGGNASILEDRLQLLARQDLDGLYRHLPRLVLQLRGDQVRIDWGVLIRDLTRWARDPHQVAKEWAQDYYRTSERLAAARKRANEQPAGSRENQETAS